MNKYQIVIVVLLAVFLLISSGFSGSEMKYYTEREINSLIKVGDSYEKIIDTLGKPTNDSLMMKKDSSTVVGRRLMYIYKQENPSVFNQKTDSYLRLWFGPDDMLLEIDYHGGKVSLDP